MAWRRKGAKGRWGSGSAFFYHFLLDVIHARRVLFGKSTFHQPPDVFYGVKLETYAWRQWKQVYLVLVPFLGELGGVGPRAILHQLKLLDWLLLHESCDARLFQEPDLLL